MWEARAASFEVLHVKRLATTSRSTSQKSGEKVADISTVLKSGDRENRSVLKSGEKVNLFYIACSICFLLFFKFF